MSYKSPIEVINEVSKKIETDFENNVMNAVFSCSISVDKDELIRVLKYDRGQYDKGFADGRKQTAKVIFVCLLDELEKQRNRYSQEYDKWDIAQKDCDREDWKADYKEKREKANGYYLMADRAIGYIKLLAKEYGVEAEII